MYSFKDQKPKFDKQGETNIEEKICQTKQISTSSKDLHTCWKAKKAKTPKTKEKKGKKQMSFLIFFLRTYDKNFKKAKQSITSRSKSSEKTPNFTSHKQSPR